MCEPTDLHEWGELLMLMMYSKNTSLAYRNALIREKAIVRDQKGTNVGWSDVIDVLDGTWNDQQCLGVLRFATPQNARRFLESDHPIRQPDFLGHVDIYLVPLKKTDMTLKGYPIMQLLVQKINFRDLYEQKYIPMMDEAVTRYGGVAFVVCRDQPWKWRGIENPGSVIINEWPNWDAYNSFVNSETGRELVKLRNQIGNGYAIAVKLHCDM